MSFKKIIAREGIIILSIALIGAIAEILQIFFLNLFRKFHGHYLYDISQIISASIKFFAIVYPVYLIVRFIVWAVRVLKQK